MEAGEVARLALMETAWTRQQAGEEHSGMTLTSEYSVVHLVILK